VFQVASVKSTAFESSKVECTKLFADRLTACLPSATVFRLKISITDVQYTEVSSTCMVHVY